MCFVVIFVGYGFVVLVLEVFYELNFIGMVFVYDDVGKDKGNVDKWVKLFESYDLDIDVLIVFVC